MRDHTVLSLLPLAAAAFSLPTRSLTKPFCIGVAGATASGKSSVVSEVVRLLDAEDRVCSVTQDCFYKDLSASEREDAYKSNYNFDRTPISRPRRHHSPAHHSHAPLHSTRADPNAFDWPQQLSVMTDLRSGSVPDVAIPEYDFVTQYAAHRPPREHSLSVHEPSPTHTTPSQLATARGARHAHLRAGDRNLRGDLGAARRADAVALRPQSLRRCRCRCSPCSPH